MPQVTAGKSGRFSAEQPDASATQGSLVPSWRGAGGVPFLDFEAFDPLDFDYVARDEGGPEAAGLGGDAKIERANGFAGRFQFGTDFRVVEGGVDVEVGDVEQIEKGLQFGGLLRVGGFFR